jgi:sugar phosphate isomerase/epimerase
MQPFRVGIDSYSLHPLHLSPFEVLNWVKAHNGDGVQFTEVHPGEQQKLDAAYLRELARSARDMGLYLEWGGGQHMPFDTATWKPKDVFPINETAAKQASALGARIIRSCSGGLMRWGDEAPPTEFLLRETARALKDQMSMLADYGVVLAIELHFEFTTFELLRLFEMCGAEPGGSLGICLDTMNLLTMLEDPVAGTERILPWVVAVHAKDGALVPGVRGLISFTTELGAGSVDFKPILTRLATLGAPLNLSIEDHGGSFNLPVFDSTFLSRFPDLTPWELSRLFKLAYAGHAKFVGKEITILARSEWPGLCGDRVARDLQNLKGIVHQMAETKKPPV